MTGIILTGLTGSGKTQVAFELARRIGGEIINLDRTFTWKYFPLSSGMSDVKEQDGIEKHLYEFLEPDEDLIPNDAYAKMVIDKAKEIISRGKVPIVEGGSPKYFNDLYLNNVSEKIFEPMIYLTYPESTDIEKKILNRIEKAIQLGLVEEIKTNLLKFRNTQFMREGKFVVPIVSYLDGRINLDKAKQDMVAGAIDLITYQKNEFSKYPNLVVIENKKPDESLDKIIKLWNHIK